MNSKFIVIEGLDGSGKSTQIRRLVEALRGMGRAGAETAEPTPTAIWSGKLNTRARVILEPDLDAAGFQANQAYDLCWKRT